MIQDMLLCYSKLALLPTHSVSAKNGGLGIFVAEVSRSGSKVVHIHLPCSPSCAPVPALLRQGAKKSRGQELTLQSPYIYIHIYMCVYTYIYI